MAAQKLCGKNESVVENAKPVRRLQSSPLIDACRKISTEGSEENEGCNLSPVGTPGARTLPFRIHREIFVLEMLRDLPGLLPFDFFDPGIQLSIRFPTLRATAHLTLAIRPRDSRFGPSDEYHRLLRPDR